MGNYVLTAYPRHSNNPMDRETKGVVMVFMKWTLMAVAAFCVSVILASAIMIAIAAFATLLVSSYKYLSDIMHRYFIK